MKFKRAATKSPYINNPYSRVDNNTEDSTERQHT